MRRLSSNSRPSDPTNNKGILADKYKSRNRYFIRKPDRSIWPLESNKKRLLKILSDQSNVVEKYMDRNKLDVKNP